jgi:predicted nucleic acid-binding Zn ribbon protein
MAGIGQGGGDGGRRRRRPVTSLGDAIASFMKRSTLGRAEQSDQISRAWAEILGPEIARRTRLSRVIRQGVLSVEVDSPALLGELSGFRKAEILKGLQERVKRKHIAELRFKLGSGF